MNEVAKKEVYRVMPGTGQQVSYEDLGELKKQFEHAEELIEVMAKFTTLVGIFNETWNAYEKSIHSDRLSEKEGFWLWWHAMRMLDVLERAVTEIRSEISEPKRHSVDGYVR